jgi:hemerythrin
MALFQWNQSYSVRVAELDRQHQSLFALLNQLHDAMLSGEGNAIIQETLALLVEYTDVHFKAEERYFRTFNYHGRRTHELEHAAFIEKLSSLRKRVETGKGRVSVETLDFMRDWLKEHIRHTDQQYADFFNEKGLH